MQALLIQVRRDAVGSSRTPLLDTMPVNIAAADIDHLAATLQYKVSHGKKFISRRNRILFLATIVSPGLLHPQLLSLQ